MKIKFFALSVATLASGLAASSANAGVVATRAALATILGGSSTLETFENINIGEGGQRYFTGTLDSNTVIDGTSGHLVAGVSYSANDFFWNGNGYYALNSRTLGDASGGRPISATFTASVGAFGLDIQGYEGFSAAGTASVYDAANALIGTFAIDRGFFGFEYAGGISRFVVSAPVGYQMMDNLEFGNVAADVPEPAMLSLFGLGAIGLGLGRRRKTA